MRTTAIILTVMSAAASVAVAADIPPDQLEFFDKKIKPLFVDKCYKCHSNEAGKSKGGLLMDSREAMRKGGDTGPSVVPGDVAKSLLITAISYKDPDLQMPPKGEKLSDQEIANLTEWVKMGAPDPREVPKGGKLSGLTDKAKQHWAYQPVTKPAMPSVKNRAWCVTPVDAFVLEKIEAKGMVPSGLAEKETLLRRATFDLIGLPPTLKEIEEFTGDTSPYAFVKVVDRLLASPHYGERWARFWLDTARYSDTTGNRDNNMNQDYRFPYAWTYRDYVVRSFNQDKPYDRFILEQLAADRLTDLKDQRDLTALGFITVGKRNGNNNDIIDDRIDTVTKGFLAMTVSCARCHDHMFDPIPTKDYYALHGVFSSIEEPKEPPIITQATKSAAADFQQKMAMLEQENRDNYYKVISEANFLFRKQASAYLKAAFYSGRNASAEELLKASTIRETEKLNRDITQAVNRIMGTESVSAPLRRFKEGNWSALDFKKLNPLVAAAFQGKNPQSIDEVADIYAKIFTEVNLKAPEYTAVLAAASEPDAKTPTLDPSMLELVQLPLSMKPLHQLNMDVLRREANGLPQGLRNRGFSFAKMNALLLTHEGADQRAMVVQDLAKPKDSPVFIRGQSGTPGDMVPRRFLEVLSGGKPTPFKQGSGRLELAQAIASKNNPLTARVIVNRVWLHHFGEGFVRTPDDLGTQAEKPTHPELLDYLSSYFMEQGWSFKKLHRLIMLSKVYQISSYTHPAFEVIDPDNRYLWRANVRRLDFESMRDSLLVMSGKLDPSVGGQPVNLTEEPYSYRRSIYGYVDRGNLPELMAHFDFSNPEAPNSKRTTTIVPQQALFLMNSPMSIDVARSILKQPAVTRSRNPRDTVYAIYRTVLGRAPKAKEEEAAYAFIGLEGREETRVLAAAKEMTEKAAKKAEERAKRIGQLSNNALSAIQNEGEMIERKPLTAWETFAHALLLSNEAAYIN
jgi:mono/diheme cytochrome c family protein